MELIRHYFPDLTPAQYSCYEKLGELYPFWNEKINLISRKDIGNLYLHHILHSLAIAKIVQFNREARVMDVGTGGGFPGVPLAIFFPDTHFHLVDSIAKKIKVVENIAEQLELRNLTCEQARAEQLKGRYDFIVSRAVTTLPEFVRWVQGKISKTNHHKIPNGILYLKGGDLAEEIQPFRNSVTTINIHDYFREDFFETKKILYLPI